MISKNRYTLYFYTFLIVIVSILLFKVELSLSISYKEALNVFINNSMLTFITKTSLYLFGQNDIALRLPFILFYFFCVILMYKITENYFKYESDRLISIIIFMVLPGVLSASLLVNSAIIVTFFTLLYIYYYQKYNKHLYILLFICLFIDNSFAILFLALFFFSFKNKDKTLLYISTILFVLSLYIYGFPTDGKPRGFLIDTVAIYAAIFSPVLFIYFIYTIYRAGIKKDRSLSWYISITALLISIIFSFRQKIYIEDFAPYVVIAIPLMLKTFLHSYRIRLEQFRKVHKIMAIIIIGMLALNVIFTFVNKPLYLIISEPKRHFVYQYHFAKELAFTLKEQNIDEILCDDEELQLRLKFYNINKGENYYLSTKEFFNYDEKISIKYYNKDLFDVYIKDLKNLK
ncbi:glycosyltransferase family 39 protein [Aliarcobacter butzleri]|uniref:ArnT family glycosyltransferase n=1 Tax=Aliarcobacter butzleri TaxID=28197 RepID=UPI001EDC105E|nr:glycosyltransferase family 39 protein [Aliarcobacter butzleri]MCG3705628.1 glycosyltransferase family 39 protein [Aliarcobacter butzleri]MDK2091589.1 glycosyltransferase family 39 protein [Aliarcobacter butzleri]